MGSTRRLPSTWSGIMLVAERLVLRAPARARPRLSLPPEGVVIFGLAGAGYLAAATLLAFRFHVVSTQALGIVANASYVVFSRDPHVAAIGFVGSPLPSILILPLLPLRAVWPALSDVGFAACIVSALFMAGAVYQLYQLFREGGVSRVPRLGLTIVFALHPLILYAAATGVAEAGYVFFLLLAARHLARWLQDRSTMGAIIAGFALAGAYLTRYDAVLCGITVTAVVGVVSFSRARDRRVATAVCDALIVGLPLAATVVLWAAAAWLVTGNALPQLLSTYGYLAQLDALRSHGIPAAFAITSPRRTLIQLLALEPALPAAGMLLIIGWFSGRARASLAAIGLLGPLTVAIVGASLLSVTFPWLRQLIVVVPLVTLLIGLGLAAGRRSWLGPLAACLMLLAAVPTTAAAMLIAQTGQEEMPVVRTIIGRPAPGTSVSTAIATDVARYLDGRSLAEGSVLVDSFTGFPVILASRTPRQFIITSDRDFALAVANPSAFGVRYLLVPAPADGNSLGSLDALNRAFPGLWPSGAASGALEQEFAGPDKKVEWRLYRVSAIAPPPAPAS
ncbi:MAG TPA: glycosyltransferase family 39 protein [Candidatus Dormibacteraeota bacterium]|nr:glycosyltransferase family 39 protein [Candidatus Dormibacteraeota bacterium]